MQMLMQHNTIVPPPPPQPPQYPMHSTLNFGSITDRDFDTDATQDGL